MTLTLKVDVSKKGVTVSNHNGSTHHDKLWQAAEAMAAQAAHQYGDDVVMAKVTIYDSYEHKAELTDWLEHHTPSLIMVERYNGDMQVAINWRLKF